MKNAETECATMNCTVCGDKNNCIYEDVEITVKNFVKKVIDG